MLDSRWQKEAEECCKTGRHALDVGANPWERDLSQRERRILIAAADNSRIKLFERGAGHYPLLKVGDEVVASNGSDFLKAMFWESFCSLCRRGVVTLSPDGTFLLSGFGVEQARKLKALGLLE